MVRLLSSELLADLDECYLDTFIYGYKDDRLCSIEIETPEDGLAIVAYLREKYPEAGMTRNVKRLGRNDKMHGGNVLYAGYGNVDKEIILRNVYRALIACGVTVEKADEYIAREYGPPLIYNRVG